MVAHSATGNTLKHDPPALNIEEFRGLGDIQTGGGRHDSITEIRHADGLNRAAVGAIIGKPVTPVTDDQSIAVTEGVPHVRASKRDALLPFKPAIT